MSLSAEEEHSPTKLIMSDLPASSSPTGPLPSISSSHS